MVSDGVKDSCATACAILSAIAVPLLLYFGVLAYNESPMLEIPAHTKKDAALGCWTAAAMYGGTFIYSWLYKMKSQRRNARTGQGYQMQQMEVY